MCFQGAKVPMSCGPSGRRPAAITLPASTQSCGNSVNVKHTGVYVYYKSRGGRLRKCIERRHGTFFCVPLCCRGLKAMQPQ